ncbi:MAG: two-partner secretion domain-containing protein [Planctomycetota bacterium]|jgi:filamentous hemagglutinin family protein
MKTFAHNPFVRFAHKSLAYLLLFCIVNMPLWALNTSDARFNGTDTVNVDAFRSYIEWEDFNTVQDQLLRFLASGAALSADHAVLNKVMNGSMTQFDGILQAGQGHIILVNPAGITIGSTASINAGRFTASTMDMMGVEDFLADSGISAANLQFEFAKGAADPSAQIALLAGSAVNAERVELLAQQINNAGTITTGNDGVVAMAAGDYVLLGEPGSDVIIQMSGIEGGIIPLLLLV